MLQLVYPLPIRNEPSLQRLLVENLSFGNRCSTVPWALVASTCARQLRLCSLGWSVSVLRLRSATVIPNRGTAQLLGAVNPRLAFTGRPTSADSLAPVSDNVWCRLRNRCAVLTSECRQFSVIIGLLTCRLSTSRSPPCVALICVVRSLTRASRCLVVIVC